jgi:hypothetical protein
MLTDPIARATLLGAIVGAVAAIIGGLGAAWWTQRQSERRARADRMFGGKAEAYAAVMRVTSEFRTTQYHWDLLDRASTDAPPTGPPALAEDQFLGLAGLVRLFAADPVLASLDELEALLFAAHDRGAWTAQDARATARELASLETAMRRDLGVA